MGSRSAEKLRSQAICGMVLVLIDTALCQIPIWVAWSALRLRVSISGYLSCTSKRFWVSQRQPDASFVGRELLFPSSTKFFSPFFFSLLFYGTAGSACEAVTVTYCSFCIIKIHIHSPCPVFLKKHSNAFLMLPLFPGTLINPFKLYSFTLRCLRSS